MIIVNEGMPGSGKSYDAVATHILAALQKGRHVYARLNGLKPDRIAAHLKLPEDRVKELLHIVADNGDETPGLPTVKQLPEIAQQDALIIVDEAHDFYPADGKKLDPATEKFFAESRHKGWDILLMTQHYPRIHPTIRGRIERKATFLKLNAIGADSRYKVTIYGPAGKKDKYLEIDTQVKKYDLAIFPLYESVKPGTENLEVYSVGAPTAWRKIKAYALIFIPILCLAGWVANRFLSGETNLVKNDKPKTVHVEGKETKPSGLPVVKQATGNLPGGAPPAMDTTGMPPAVAYFFASASQGRPRLAGVMISETGQPSGIVEIRRDQQHLMERLTFRQLRTMGVSVSLHEYGVKLSYEKASVIATNWPVDMPGTIPDTMRSPDRPDDGMYRPAPRAETPRPAFEQPAQQAKRAFPFYKPPGG